MRRLVATAFAALALAGAAQADGIEGESAEALIGGWVAAVASGDAEMVAGVLAPEFQLVRADGTGHDVESYVAGGFPVIESVPEVEGAVETGDGAIRVIRYSLVLDEEVDRAALTRRAPRLTVFRQIDGAWYVTAHANFAVPES
ncbi:nuclear transport factor 2 family protein [Pseudoruegeria sp. HB172150]|uniref:nuclear transport factor 2 family protein n=1 Tax=Pseudoruegeria sp. HB172150 TaxID=2721164 RepID=UPI0015578058|nr:nuclear transport factor 2 family protein [Pseudoruegeria sp. HB172150]